MPSSRTASCRLLSHLTCFDPTSHREAILEIQEGAGSATSRPVVVPGNRGWEGEPLGVSVEQVSCNTALPAASDF